jgi:hypothetical protein
MYENKPPKRQDQLAKTGSTRQPINGTDFWTGWPDWTTSLQATSGDCLLWGSFLKITYVHDEGYAIILTKNFWATFWAIFFTNSSGHPVFEHSESKSVLKKVGKSSMEVCRHHVPLSELSINCLHKVYKCWKIISLLPIRSWQVVGFNWVCKNLCLAQTTSQCDQLIVIN